jgi:hypothetical protein
MVTPGSRIPGLYVLIFSATPFENWTRHEARVLAEEMLHVDYSAPIDALRKEARAWSRHPRSGTVASGLFRSSTRRRRPLSYGCWRPRRTRRARGYLKCEVREALVAFLRDRHPGALPRVRAALTSQ